MTNKHLAILGASGHGKVIADLAEQLGYCVSFYDDAYPQKTHLEHWPIQGTLNNLLARENIETNIVIAIGNNTIREQKTASIMQRTAQSSFTFPVLIHPTATVSPYATVQAGSVVFAHAVVNSFAVIGQGCIINTAAVIEHDCILDDFVHISPNVALAGGVKIGHNTWIGIGSQVKQLVNIGNNTLIGAGSTVLKDISANLVAYGSPAVVVSDNG